MLAKSNISIIRCKYCGSPNIIKFGTYEGVQRYFCKNCKRKFVLDTLPKMKTPMLWIAAALDMYYRGMPLDSIQGHMKLVYGRYFSEAGIYKWIVRFTKEAIKQSKDFKPIVGNKWIADETAINIGGKKLWYWDIIDTPSRYLLASHLSKTRTTEDAQVLVEKAIARAWKVPKTIVTDKLRAYIDGIDLASGGIVRHVRSTPFTEVDHTNLIERFHGTLKERTNVIRNFSNLRTAKLLTDGWLVQYNFFKEHEALGNTSPAKRMNVELPFNNWNDIARMSGKDSYVEEDDIAIAQPTTEKHRKSAYMRKAKRVSRAKKKVATVKPARRKVAPAIGIIRC